MNKVVIIDGNSLVNRAYYALPPLATSKGKIYNAVFGFVNILTRLITEHNPTHLVVAFDAGKKNFRHELYKEYKGTRKGMPEELACQMQPLKDCLSAMNIKIVEQMGIEADDIIGTLSTRFSLPCVIVTGDRDCLQLINNKTEVWLTKHGISDIVSMNERQLKEEMNLTPSQIIDLKGLMGDASDNIPGVAGVGEKTALNLLEQYKSVEGVYENLDNITGKLHDKLMQNKETAFLSKKLATIVLDADIDCSEDDCLIKEPFNNKVKEMFEEFEFSSLLKRKDLFSQQSEQKVEEKAKQIELENVADFLKILAENKVTNVAFLQQNEQFMFAFNENEYYSFSNCLFSDFRSIFEDAKLEKIVHCKKKLQTELSSMGVKLLGKSFDVSLAVYLLNSNIKNEDITKALEYLQINEINAAGLFKARNICENELKEKQLCDLYYNIELPLEEVLFDMEQTGIKIDTNTLSELADFYHNELDNLIKNIYELAGEEFNINSPKQLGHILFDKLKLYSKNNKKQSTAVDKLEALYGQHPIIELILRYRTVSKLLSTYIDGIKPYIHADNTIHTTFNQTLTVTGRLSSNEPNLQNIPARTDEGKQLRKMFVAFDNDSVLLSADYSQIELRLLAHYSVDANLVKAYTENTDIHAITASQIFHTELEKVSKTQRRAAKAVNFGIIYGISPYGLSRQLGISTAQAKDYIDRYFETYPTIKNFLTNSIQMAKEKGYVTTLFGRRREITEVFSTNHNQAMFGERAAMNMPLQGTASDIIKLAMVKLYKELKNLGLNTKMILQVHDELIFNVPKSELDIVKKLVKEYMENVVKLNVPLVVEIKTGKNWYEME